MRVWSLMALLALGGCGYSLQPAKPDAVQPNGRWTIVPLGTVPNFNQERNPAVWILDTQTGRLSVCQLNLGGWNVHCIYSAAKPLSVSD